MNCLNKLINLEIKTDGEGKILEFINSEFHLREPSNEEFNSYFNEKPKGKKKSKSKRISHDATTGKSLPYSSSGKDSTNDSNYNETSHYCLSPIFENNDSFQKFIFDKLKKMQEQCDRVEEQSDELKEQYNTMKDELELTQDKLELIQNKLELIQNKLELTQDKLELTHDKLQKEKKKGKEAEEALKNTNYELLQVKLDKKKLEKMEKQIMDLQLDMKIIKIGAVYKAIIDIFAKVFDLNLSDSYRGKKDNIIHQLKLFDQNKKIKDLQDFLADILACIYKGNNLAHFIDKNIVPLDFVFNMLEENCKLNYSSLKPILQKLSFNETLKYAYDGHFCQDDYDKLLQNIEFTKEDLQKSLL